MKYAIAFRNHVGPIQTSLRLIAEARGIDVLVGNARDMNVEHNWDDYDALLWFDNRVPTLKTSAKIFWWMCDLRVPETLGGKTTADYIGICNKQFLREYENFYGVPAIYVPQCGNDTEIVEGRNLGCDVLFLGHPGKPTSYEGLVQMKELTREQVVNKEFHWNRLPVISALRDAGLSVEVISQEGATSDSKWLYQNTPINLSISLPVEGYTSNRTYNILASRGFCLVAWFPGLEDLFENHKHLVWFSFYDEAVELAKRYLEKPQERDKIREAGYREYLASHTAAHRVDTMLGAMS